MHETGSSSHQELTTAKLRGRVVDAAATLAQEQRYRGERAGGAERSALAAALGELEEQARAARVGDAAAEEQLRHNVDVHGPEWSLLATHLIKAKNEAIDQLFGEAGVAVGLLGEAFEEDPLDGIMLRGDESRIRDDGSLQLRSQVDLHVWNGEAWTICKPDRIVTGNVQTGPLPDPRTVRRPIRFEPVTAGTPLNRIPMVIVDDWKTRSEKPPWSATGHSIVGLTPDNWEAMRLWLGDKELVGVWAAGLGQRVIQMLRIWWLDVRNKQWATLTAIIDRAALRNDLLDLAIERSHPR